MTPHQCGYLVAVVIRGCRPVDGCSPGVSFFGGRILPEIDPR